MIEYVDVDFIAKITGLSVERVLEIKEENSLYGGTTLETYGSTRQRTDVKRRALWHSPFKSNFLQLLT
ncbi:hypothetical protein [Psychrobacillus sp. L3]|uniref:hypothetical protein n=1 Tax=Psychrobacillus sp. L3 TaxID=3236891 RepID=UPI0036F34ABD